MINSLQQKREFLGIKDVTTERQKKNGTVTLKLPIKKYGKFIEVASFKSGYVRNNNCGHSNYQLNKQVDGKPEYYKLSNGDYRKYTGKERVLIPNEQDRLQYLIKSFFVLSLTVTIALAFFNDAIVNLKIKG